MENIKVQKQQLLVTLRVNREKHRAIFMEALDGYKAAVIKALESSLEKAKNGQRILLHFQLQEPADQTKDYDRVIRMLEMSVDDLIELDEHSFTQYVMDDWNWKRQFLTSNSAYSATATSLLALG